MATLVVAAAGAWIGGAAITGTVLGMSGAAIGWAVGSALGSALFQPKIPTQYNRQQVMNDLRVVGTEYGQPIPKLAGSRRMGGQLWWNSDRRAIETTTSETLGGKGGGGEQTVVTTIVTYDVDLLIGLTNNQIAGIARIWNNGKLIWNATEGAPIATVNNSAGTEDWSRMTVYVGSSTQLPDPTYEAAVTTANAIAYRGRSYVFFEAFHLGQQGVLPNLTFEVVADGSRAFSNLAFAAVAGAPGANYYYSAYGDGAYVIADGSGNLSYTHDNGVTWTTSAPFGAVGGQIIYGIPNDVPTFICAAANGVWRSVDRGESWINSGTIISANGGCFGYPDVAGMFVLMVTGTSCYTSPTGAAWTARSMPVSATWRAAVWVSAHSKFIAVNDTNSGAQAASSTDGKTWATVATPTSPVATYASQSIAYNGVSTLLTSVSPYGFASYDGGTTFVHYVLPNYPSFSGFGGSIIYANHLWVEWKDLDEIMTTDDLTANWDLWSCPGSGANRGLSYGGNRIWTQRDGSPYTLSSTLTEIETVTKLPRTVASVQSEICIAAGLTASQFDVTALSSITRLVDSFVWNTQSSARADSESLMAAYFYEAVESDKIYFKPRGSASVATLVYADLGASESESATEPLALKQTSDLEIPSQISITYANINFDYQTDTQYSDRVVSPMAGTVSNVTMTVGMTPAMAKAVADTMLLDQVASRFGTTISLLGEYSRLEPTDPVTVTDVNGSTFRMRLVKRNDAYPLLTFDAVLDDASILSSQAVTSTDYTSSTTVAGLQDTQMQLMDIPILQDADDDAGFYVATKGDDSDYPGAAIFRSPSNVTYTQRVTNPSPATFGLCTSTLGDWTGPRIFDETSTVGVNVDEGTLSSSTKDAVLDDLSVNAMLIGSEIIQFVTATLVSAGRYTLSSLLRGGRGTEWAMTGHAANERCVRLSTTGVRRLSLQNNQLGQSYYYKGVTLGRAISSANARTFTGNGVGLEPFSPYDLRLTRELNGDVTFTWQRRSRLSVRMIGTMGISLPLGEETELYEIDIFAAGSPTFGTVIRTLEAVTTTVTYTAAQQSLDFGSPTPPAFNLRIYQMSQLVNRGYVYEATV